MTIDTWLLYVGTVLIFMSTPGPSHLLILAVSMSTVFHRSLATAAGDLSANAIQILLAGLGLAAVVTGSRYGFAIIKWAGVSYLIWVGIRQIVVSYRNEAASRDVPVASLRNCGFVDSSHLPPIRRRWCFLRRCFLSF